jgi:hypothetical protein
MKKLVLLSLTILPFFLFSQDSLKQYKNSLALELFGETGSHYNITYSRVLYTTKKDIKFDGCITLLPPGRYRGHAISFGTIKTRFKHNYRVSLGVGKGTTPIFHAYFSAPNNIFSNDNLISGSLSPQSFYFSNLGLKYKFQIANRVNLFGSMVTYYYPRMSKSFVNKKEALFFIQGLGVEFNF